MSVVPEPNKESIEKYLDKWGTLENYRLQESSLGRLFHELCPDNSCIQSILLKVSALNDFYSTNIYDTYSVTKHIKDLNIEYRLNEDKRGRACCLASSSARAL